MNIESLLIFERHKENKHKNNNKNFEDKIHSLNNNITAWP